MATSPRAGKSAAACCFFLGTKAVEVTFNELVSVEKLLAVLEVLAVLAVLAVLSVGAKPAEFVGVNTEVGLKDCYLGKGTNSCIPVGAYYC